MAEGGIDQPGNRDPAPPPLDLVQAFVNTWDREGGVERFDSPASLAAWLRTHRLIRARDRVSGRDLRDALELREALRELLLEHNGEPASAHAHATFARYAATSLLAASLDEKGEVVLAAARGGAAGAWSRIMAAIAQASTAGTWLRLKACRADVCQWAFFDHSKNRSSHWCTMEICGARAKMRRYRERHPRRGTPMARPRAVGQRPAAD
jgi:predicted RNA-binding Zn ribbon-like protein